MTSVGSRSWRTAPAPGRVLLVFNELLRRRDRAFLRGVGFALDLWITDAFEIDDARDLVALIEATIGSHDEGIAAVRRRTAT